MGSVPLRLAAGIGRALSSKEGVNARRDLFSGLETPDNKERELRAAAERMGHEVVEVCRDHAVRAARAGTSARASRPCHKDAARRKVDVVMAWSVDRLGRSNLVAFLEHLRETLVFPASAGAGHHHLFAPRYVPMLRGLRGGTCLVSKAVCLGTCDRG